MSNSIFGSPAFLLFKDTQNFQIGLLVVEDGPPKVCKFKPSNGQKCRKMQKSIEIYQLFAAVTRWLIDPIRMKAAYLQVLRLYFTM